MSMKEITKNQLVALIRECIDGKLSSIELQEWMIQNYEPLEVKVGENEAQHTVEAMNIVMNEYELAETDRFTKIGWELALKFISCSEDHFDQGRNRFIRDGFTD